MKRSVNAIIFVAAFAAGALLLPAGSAQVQMRQTQKTQMHQTCKPFHAMVQGTLPTPNPFEDKVCFASGPVWGGAGDCANSFTYEAQAVVLWPTANALGRYKANARIVKGTGRFASASGHLDIGDPFILWPDANSPFGVYGRRNAEISGNICGVQ